MDAASTRVARPTVPVAPLRQHWFELVSPKLQQSSPFSISRTSNPLLSSADQCACCNPWCAATLPLPAPNLLVRSAGCPPCDAVPLLTQLSFFIVLFIVRMLLAIVGEMHGRNADREARVNGRQCGAMHC